VRSGDVTSAHGQETEVTQPVTSTNGHQEPADNFDRRRQALRTKREAVTPEPDAVTLVPPAGEEVPEEEPSRIAAKLREIESAERTLQQVAAVEQPDEAPSETEPQPIREEQMNQLASIAPTHARGDALDVRDKLQELRIQLGQIQQIALQAEQLLAGIAPQVDDFAARIADVEAVLDRWNGRTRNAA
jgi:hypothetical protein